MQNPFQIAFESRIANFDIKLGSKPYLLSDESGARNLWGTTAALVTSTSDIDSKKFKGSDNGKAIQVNDKKYRKYNGITMLYIFV